MITAAGTLVLLGLISPVALLVVLRDGWIALAILAAATGAGLCIVKALRLKTLTAAWHLMLAVSLGLGLLSLLMLALGTMGVLQRPVWIALLCLLIAAGVLEFFTLFRRRAVIAPPQTVPLYHWAWLLIIGFAALSFFGAALPPGLLWPGEANGYDVLEYHLGAPREYFDAGRIHYLPHNIYSNFPFNVEMIYLLSMILHGDPVDAVFTAQIFHALLGLLTVAACWLAGREIGPRAATVAGLAAATCPFLVYLSGLAYVENGLLYFAAMSCATLLRASGETSQPNRWALISGLLCGLACGCKYTAVPMVLLPLTATLFILDLKRRSFQFSICIAFLLGAALTFGPWMLRNIVYTGNPVFPLAYELFGAKPGIWNEDGAARWHAGHLPAPQDSSFAGRCSKLWSEIAGSKLFGPIIFMGIFAGAILLIRIVIPKQSATSTRERPAESPLPSIVFSWVLMCGLLILFGGGTWLVATHLVGRFVIVLLIPAALLVGCAIECVRMRFIQIALIVLLLTALGFNMWTTWQLFTNEITPYISYNHDLGLAGNTNWFTSGRWPGSAHIPVLNELLANSARILVIGDARAFYLRPGADYCVVFNRNPFAEAAAERTPDKVLQWLRDQGYSQVYVDWGEMRRLRNSRYGFWKSIDESLFETMTKEGLEIVQNFETREGGKIYATLFNVGGKPRS